MPKHKSKNLYNQNNIDTMEMVYGRGYLSAGGDAEVARIVDGFDLKAGRVLDLGCGLGGASVTMARDLGATDVVGFDIDEEVLARASLLVVENQLEDRIQLVHGVPGVLQFADQSFDLVYLTAVACHMSDLGGFFEEIARVLKPDGWLAGSDWMVREKNQEFRVWDDLLRDRGLNFYFVDQPEFSRVLKSVGFQQIRFNDRTAAFTRFSAASSLRVAQELKPLLLSSLGDEGYRAFKQWTDVRYSGLKNGGMSYQQLYAQKSGSGH
ncbi:MAG: methyltransferase domain-containing protein [Gammaproteobacteria bacterium]|nr:methyltransferase domain-containing protein [Gammaproteobacteria bacterium]